MLARQKAMSQDRLRTALEFEERQIAKAADRLAEDVWRESKDFVVNASAAGHGPGSGIVWRSLLGFELKRLEKMAQKAADIRRDICKRVPELGTAESLARWRDKMQATLDAHFAAVHSSMARLLGNEDQLRKMILDGDESLARFSKIRAVVAREAELITAEVSLGMHEHPEKRPGITVRIDTLVGPVNLGTILGDMNTAIASLIQGADGERLAQGLKELAEAIGAAQELGEQRDEILEGLAMVSQEATKPPGERRSRLVKFLLERWKPILMSTAALAEIWTAVEPLLKGWFAIP